MSDKGYYDNYEPMMREVMGRVGGRGPHRNLSPSAWVSLSADYGLAGVGAVAASSKRMYCSSV